MRTALRQFLLDFLVHHNPFYLISALCMIAGCYALNGALGLRSGDLAGLLLLLATLNVYEFLLIGLGVWLIRRHGRGWGGRQTLRDGRTLLLLQAVFLLDLTFLNAEAATAGPAAGLVISLTHFALAVVKVSVVLRALSAPTHPFPWRTLGYVLPPLAALSLVPCYFKWANRAEEHGVGPAHFYAVWWVVGLGLPLLRELQRRLTGTDPVLVQDGPESLPTRPSARRVLRTMAELYTTVSFASLLAHMGLMHWVYQVPFHPANFSPVLLGLTVLLVAAAPHDFALLRLALPAAAVWLSAGPSAGLRFGPVEGVERLTFTPLLLAAVAAYVAYTLMLFRRYARYLLCGGALAAAAVLFGPTLAQVLGALESAWRWTVTGVKSLIPKTAVQWGVVAVAAAFAFLGLGAAVSLRARPGTTATPDSGDAPRT